MAARDRTSTRRRPTWTKKRQGGLTVERLEPGCWAWSAYHNSLCCVYGERRSRSEAIKAMNRYIREHNRWCEFVY